jgi:predicted HicB family RNase H-like nuclease
MASPKKFTTTYRLTPELDSKITEQAKQLGISKNALVQMTLTKAITQDNLAQTGTD